MNRDALSSLILESLTPLALARESVIEGCKPIVEGVTHCLSCGFHQSTARHVVTHRNRCLTPEWHAA